MITNQIHNPFSPDYKSQITPMQNVKIIRSIAPHGITNIRKNIALNEEGKNFRLKQASI